MSVRMEDLTVNKAFWKLVAERYAYFEPKGDIINKSLMPRQVFSRRLHCENVRVGNSGKMEH